MGQRSSLTASVHCVRNPKRNQQRKTLDDGEQGLGWLDPSSQLPKCVTHKERRSGRARGRDGEQL